MESTIVNRNTELDRTQIKPAQEPDRPNAEDEICWVYDDLGERDLNEQHELCQEISERIRADTDQEGDQ